MSEDKLQDVFPIVFQFVQGEKATAVKLTGLVKQTDNAFSRIGNAIGDPWEYQAHTAGGTAVNLSPERLAQTSLARFAGPSDWVSPFGGCWNEATTGQITIYLSANRTSWCVGFPLVKVTSDLDETPNTGDVTPLVWGTDIYAVADVTGCFTTEVASLEDINEAGDFYINYYTGVITTYSPSSGAITLGVYADRLHMFGPGVPWGTSNVIPTWTQSTVCTVTEDGGSPAGGLSTYTITLPTVTSQPRTPSPVLGAVTPYGEGALLGQADSSFGMTAVGATASYRLPLALTSQFSADDRIPDGYIYLWDEANSRILAQTTFYYLTETTIRVITPESWLTTGASVRILVPGTSLAEAIHYTMVATRENRHVGLTGGQSIYSLAYTAPLSHDHLADRYSGNIAYTQVYKEKFLFRESDYPTNPHPQYLHRAGFMDDDSDGNSANAMRGHLAFAGNYTGSPLGMDGDDSGCMRDTYGIFFGGISAGSTATSIAFKGGEDIEWEDSGSSYTRYIAQRFGFGLLDTGAKVGSTYIDDEEYGALTITSFGNTPLYLEGDSLSQATNDYRGAVLGFDLARFREMNYIKLLPGYRSGTYDKPHMPANIGQSTFNTSLDIMPGLTDAVAGKGDRVCAEQVREFRFRGIPYIYEATNTMYSLGGAGTRGIGGDIEEFEHYYPSPGMVGADFFNVYSNAVFFSEEGDGIKTSFIDSGHNWLDHGSIVPTGLFYKPPYTAGVTTYGGEFYFSVRNRGETTNYTAAKFSYDGTTEFRCENFNIIGHNTSEFYVNTTELDLNAGSNGIDIDSSGAIDITTNSGASITLDSINDINIYARNGSPTYYNDITISADRDIDVTATRAFKLDADGIDIVAGVGTAAATYLSNDRIYIRTRSIPFAPGTDDISIFCGSDFYTYCDNDVTINAGGYGAATYSTLRLSHNALATLYTEDTGVHHEVRVYSDHIQLTKGGVSYLSLLLSSLNSASGTDLVVNASGYVFKKSSSIKYKKNISVIDNADWIYKLKPVEFQYKTDSISHYGFLAEEVAEVNKTLVMFDNDKPDGLYNSDFIAGIIKVLQEQKQEIEELKAKLENR